MVAEAWNYLELEDLLKARLTDQVVGISVFSAADLEGVVEKQQKVPAIHVLYFEDRLLDESQGGDAQIVYQLWVTVVVVRNVQNAADGVAVRATAGPFIQQILAALQGWDPGTRWGNLKRVLPAPRPLFKDGFGYCPLLWRSKVVTP